MKSKGILTLIVALTASLVFACGASAGPKQWYYPDVDLDGYGDDKHPGVYTNKPANNCPTPVCVTNNSDCNDVDSATYPLAPELCDGLATDCSAPSYPALPDNEVDNDGDGFVECTFDVSGWQASPISGGQDCDDIDPTCYPGVDACGCSAITVASAGQIWMDRNLGASMAATNSTNSAAYGDLYQWGRGADGHQLRTSALTTTRSSTDDPGHGDFIATSNHPMNWLAPANTELWQGGAGTNNPCPAGFRLPTKAEFETEIASWGSYQNAEGAMQSPLKLPMAGWRSIYGDVIKEKYMGWYWNSTNLTDDGGILEYTDTTLSMYYGYKSAGLSVRCIMD